METAKLAQTAADAVDTHELVSLLQQMVRIRSYSAGGEEGSTQATSSSWPGRRLSHVGQA
jgi:hypothetical protein